MSYKCPLCGSRLTEKHYHNVVKLQKKQDKMQKGTLEKLEKKIASARAAESSAKRKERDTRIKAKHDIGAAKKAATLAEKRKTAIRSKRLLARIKKLQEEKAMLQKHTSPQQIGLADESVLFRKLRQEFPFDKIEHTGKGGDILHHVMFDREETGCIVYECKHTDRIASSHIAQTALAKRTRQASYAILVTTGTRKGFYGLDQESGVFIVAQAGTLTLARICRDSLVTMAKQRLDVTTKAAAARRLMDYVTSPICKTPLEEAISHAERAHKNLLREVKQHFSDWKERHELYESIHYDVSHVQNNLDRVLGGSAPLRLEKIKLLPLALPLKR